MTYTPEQTAAALAYLRAWLKPGDTLLGIRRHRSRSGRSKSITLATIIKGELVDLDPQVCRALTLPFDRKHGGIRTDACGSELVSHLSRVLFPDAGGNALRFRRI